MSFVSYGGYPQLVASPSVLFEILSILCLVCTVPIKYKARQSLFSNTEHKFIMILRNSQSTDAIKG